MGSSDFQFEVSIYGAEQRAWWHHVEKLQEGRATASDAFAKVVSKCKQVSWTLEEDSVLIYSESGHRSSLDQSLQLVQAFLQKFRLADYYYGHYVQFDSSDESDVNVDSSGMFYVDSRTVMRYRLRDFSTAAARFYYRRSRRNFVGWLWAQIKDFCFGVPDEYIDIRKGIK